MNDFEIINKEDVPKHHFISFEVLDTEEEKKQRASDLEKAMLIGNGDKGKTKLFFTMPAMKKPSL